MGDFVEEAYHEIDEDERKRIRSDSKVIGALRSKKVSVGKIPVGETEVEFRLSINKKLRRKLAYYKSQIGTSEPTVEKVEMILYELLSSLSTEDPWTSWATWSVYDDDAEEYGAQEVLMVMLKQINAHMEDVKNFR